MREIQILEDLDHPNIVRLIETYQGPEKLYIVMELFVVFLSPCLFLRSSSLFPFPLLFLKKFLFFIFYFLFFIFYFLFFIFYFLFFIFYFLFFIFYFLFFIFYFLFFIFGFKEFVECPSSTPS